MDKSLIVILGNIGYGIILVIAWLIRHKQHQEKANNLKRANFFEYYAYSAFGINILGVIAITLFRNSYVFNNWFPTSFIIQFVIQFVILICFILPDGKIIRYIASYMCYFFLFFLVINGLYKKDPKYSKIEMTTVEIEKLSDDIDHFSLDLTKRIQQVSKDMNSVINEIKEREGQINSINNLLKKKEREHKELTSIIEVDKQKANEILTALNVHPPTIMDRVLDALIGAFFGWFLTVVVKLIPFKRKN